MAIFTGCSFLVTFLLICMSSVAYSSDVPSECKGTYFADPNDCNKFYVCVHDKPMSWTCPGELHWNDEFKTCDWEYSANCAARNNNQQPHQPQNYPMSGGGGDQPDYNNNGYDQSPSDEHHQDYNNEYAQHDEHPSGNSIDVADGNDSHSPPSHTEPDSNEPLTPAEPVESAQPNQSNTKCGGAPKKSVCYCTYTKVLR